MSRQIPPDLAAPPLPMIEVGHASHTGLRREFNEDTYWADTGLGLFLVVDGMGGHRRGEMAAAIARDAMVDAVRTGRALESAIRATGAAIATFAATAPGNAPTGASLALLRIDGNRFEIVRIGDARVYLGHHHALEPETPVDEPGSDDAARAPANRNRITEALGITPSADLSAEPAGGTLERGMQFLLCTDGLGEALGGERIAAILGRTDLAAQECVDHLMLAALAAGGRDNITLVLARVA